MSNQRKAYIWGIIAVGFWSTVASVFKLTLNHIDPIQLLFYSSLFSLIFLSLIITIKGSFHQLLAVSKKQITISLLLGILNPFLYYLVLFKAYDLLPAQEAQPINFTWALILTFLSIIILKQKIRMIEILAGFVGYFGVLIISTHGTLTNFQFSNSLGVLLALLSTVIWALYWIYNTKSAIDPVLGLFLNFLFGVPLIFLACLFFSDFNVNFEGLVGSVYVGAFEMGITFVCWLTALKLSENTAKIGNLIFIAPFFSLVLIQHFVGEEILPSTFIGLIFITVSVLMQRIPVKNAPQTEGVVRNEQ
ncbi:DMT family transporter [bacterium]|nr:DMT family transporter [bacterium]